MRQPPTGTVTFLFTDIEGSTKLWEEEPDAMRHALARHDQLLHQAITENNGFVFKTVGDSFCAAFSTAPDAVRAALSAQQAMVSQAWELRSPLWVRMALHTGAAEERAGDYFGPTLNRVARLMAAGHGRQTLLSGATQELTRDHLPEDMTLRDLGQRRLKDLERPEHVYQAVHSSLVADFPPLRSLDNPDLPNNLPQQATSFVGREKEIAEIKTLLGGTRLLTLAGSGGAGKSRLSLQAAADLLDQYFDGVWLVELASLTDPALVPQAVADVLGVSEQAGKTFHQSLVDALKEKRLLLIWDNCEHLLAACASLAADLLRSCPHLHILASSREPLNVVGEQTYRVPSLSLPDPKATLDVETLSQYEAVHLFIVRAQAARPAFAVTNANAPALAQVCCTLDGIPLAIELASARVRVLSVEQINTRLEDRFNLLTGGSRTLMPRQQTLRALIDWSYDLLTEPEQGLLRCLSVFAGGWSLNAAQAIGAGEDSADWETLDRLMSLVDKSLVIAETQRETTRYTILETVRQYGRDRLNESGESAAVRRRHRDYFLALSEEAKAKLSGSEQAAWLEVLEEEHDNLRLALTFCLGEPDSADQGVRLGAALQLFWRMRGYLTEARTRLQAVLALPGGQVRTRARSDALSGAGVLADMQGDYIAARALHQESLLIAREIGDVHGIAVSLNNLGNVAYAQGDYGTARSLFEESLTLKRELADRRGIATSLMNLGLVANDQGNHAAARLLQEESLTIYREIENRNGIADALLNLGNTVRLLKDHDRANALQEEGLAIFRELGDSQGIAISLMNQGTAASLQGDPVRAQAAYHESLTIFRDLEDRYSIAECLKAFGALAHSQGNGAHAARLWGAASVMQESIGSLSPVSSQENLEREVSAARVALGNEAFSAAWDEGYAMTMAQAIHSALTQG